MKIKPSEIILSDLELSEDSKNALREIITDKGCSFCFEDHVPIEDLETNLELMARQWNFWFDYFKENGIEDFGIQILGESPLLYLDRIYERVRKGDFFVHINTRTDYLVNLEGKVRKALSIGQKRNIKTILKCIGFESFSEKDLELYNKGLDPKTNIRAIKLLRDLKEEFGNNIVYRTEDHGFIMFNPYSTLESLEANLEAIDKLEIFGLFGHDFIFTVLLPYRRAPIFFRIKEDDLIRLDENNVLFESYEFVNGKVRKVYEKFSKFKELSAKEINPEEFGPYRHKIINKIDFKALKSMIEKARRNEISELDIEHLFRDICRDIEVPKG